MPELLASKIFLAVLGDGDEVVRIQFATSLGMMLLRNRPIVLMALPGVLIPPKLRLIADVLIEDADMADPGTQERLADALRQVGLPDQE
jgi:hypothetical protein